MDEVVNASPEILEVQDWGRVEYEEALGRQRAMAEERVADRVPDRLVRSSPSGAAPAKRTCACRKRP